MRHLKISIKMTGYFNRFKATGGYYRRRSLISLTYPKSPIISSLILLFIFSIISRSIFISYLSPLSLSYSFILIHFYLLIFFLSILIHIFKFKSNFSFSLEHSTLFGQTISLSSKTFSTTPTKLYIL